MMQMIFLIKSRRHCVTYNGNPVSLPCQRTLFKTKAELRHELERHGMRVDRRTGEVFS